MFTVSAALLTVVNHPCRHRSNNLTRPCALFVGVDFVLHLKNSERTLAEKKKMVDYKQLPFVSLALPGDRNGFSDLRGSERSERTVVRTSLTDERAARRKLRLKQKSNSPPRDWVSHFSQRGYFVGDRLAGIFRRQ